MAKTIYTVNDLIKRIGDSSDDTSKWSSNLTELSPIKNLSLDGFSNLVQLSSRQRKDYIDNLQTPNPNGGFEEWDRIAPSLETGVIYGDNRMLANLSKEETSDLLETLDLLESSNLEELIKFMDSKEGVKTASDVISRLKNGESILSSVHKIIQKVSDYPLPVAKTLALAKVLSSIIPAVAAQNFTNNSTITNMTDDSGLNNSDAVHIDVTNDSTPDDSGLNSNDIAAIIILSVAVVFTVGCYVTRPNSCFPWSRPIKPIASALEVEDSSHHI